MKRHIEVVAGVGLRTFASDFRIRAMAASRGIVHRCG